MFKRKKLIVKIICGMGNQMFQYAFAKALSKKTGLKVFFDRSDLDEREKNINANKEKFKNHPPQIFSTNKFCLDIFNLNMDFLPKEKIEKYIDTKERKSKVPGEIRKIFKLEKYVTPAKRYDQALYCEYSDEYFHPNKNTYYNGYFQNEKYLSGVEDEIRKDFTLPKISTEDKFNTEMIDKIRSHDNSVMLHVRLGDYVTNNWHLSENYYKKAMLLMEEKVKDPKYFIFSDGDIESVKKMLDLDKRNFEFVGNTNMENKEDWKDLKLMTECKHSIIANSSFSWWGAYLTMRKDKIVTAPTPWLLDRDETICSDWYKIKVN